MKYIDTIYSSCTLTIISGYFFVLWKFTTRAVSQRWLICHLYEVIKSWVPYDVSAYLVFILVRLSATHVSLTQWLPKQWQSLQNIITCIIYMLYDIRTWLMKLLSYEIQLHIKSIWNELILKYNHIYDIHNDVIKCKHFPHYWPFVWGIHRSSVNYPHKASDTELWCFLWSDWVKDREAGDLRRIHSHYDVIVVITYPWPAISWIMFNSSPPGKNDCHFTDDLYRCFFVNENVCIFIKISLKFLPKGPIDNNPTLV